MCQARTPFVRFVVDLRSYSLLSKSATNHHKADKWSSGLTHRISGSFVLLFTFICIHKLIIVANYFKCLVMCDEVSK